MMDMALSGWLAVRAPALLDVCRSARGLAPVGPMDVFVEARNAAVEMFGEAAHRQHQHHGDAEEKHVVLRGKALGACGDGDAQQGERKQYAGRSFVHRVC
jgi:hypothetical protein